MAEYYPLLAKAVAGLPNSTPETRRALYDRARKALLAQLQSLQPPVPEADVARETRALDMAMARIEAELTAPNGAAAAATPSPPQVHPAAKTSPVPPPLSAPLPRTPPSQPRPNGATPANGMETKEHRGNDTQETSNVFTAPDVPKTLRPEVSRPYAPQPEAEDAPQSRRLWIVIGVVVVVVAMVAVAAWKLRDRPQDLAFKSAAQSQPDKGSGKIVERVDGIAKCVGGPGLR